MEYRFSNLITIIYVVLLYGNILPLLYPIAGLVFLAAYWVDKVFILTNIYLKPYQFEGGIVLAVNHQLKYSMVLYFIGGALSFSNSDIMSVNFKYAGTTVGFIASEFYEQKHMQIYYYGQVSLLVIFLFAAYVVPRIVSSCKREVVQNNYFSTSDDFYNECSFEFLTREVLRS